MQQVKKQGGQISAVLTLIALITSTFICFVPILLIGLVKLVPYHPWQDFCGKIIDGIATKWCSFNNFYTDKMQNINWNIIGQNNLNTKDWYLVIANHQSWLDIVILQRIFNRKIPVLKFFIKDQLKWVPFLGFAWWAMGCPFMKRYSKEYLQKKPHKRGKDISATLKAVEKFKRKPASVMNFIEGTRFTKEKQQQQNSPHNHLLKPKAGGISFILSTMGKQLNTVLDVTIIYPKQHSLWDFLCRRIDSITVNIRQLTIPNEFTTTKLLEDPEIQSNFREWLNQQWTSKDQLITSLK